MVKPFSLYVGIITQPRRLSTDLFSDLGGVLCWDGHSFSTLVTHSHKKLAYHLVAVFDLEVPVAKCDVNQPLAVVADGSALVPWFVHDQ